MGRVLRRSASADRHSGCASRLSDLSRLVLTTRRSVPLWPRP